MMCTEQSKSFTYWKRPWQKWLFLIAGILQAIGLLLSIQEYGDIAKAQILSAPVWESYAAQQSFRCAVNGLTAAIFLGVFAIGNFAQSKKAARMAEGILLLVLAFAWGIVGFALPITAQSATKIVWGLLLLVTLGGSIYTFWKIYSRG